MSTLTVKKSKVGPLLKRYVNGEFQHVEQKNEHGVKRVAILGLDNSHSRDYKVGYASDPVLTIKGGAGESHDDIRQSIEELRLISMDNLTPIEIPHGEGWVCGFKSLPDTIFTVPMLYKRANKVLDEYELLGDENGFTAIHAEQ